MWRIIIISIVFCLMSGVNDAAEVAKYGEEVEYTPTDVIQYPDFSLRFLGVMTKQATNSNHKWNEYTFQAKAGDDLVDVVWILSGAIAPTKFKIGGKEYLLLKQKKKLTTPLPSDLKGTLIIWEYDAAKKNQFLF